MAVNVEHLRKRLRQASGSNNAMSTETWTLCDALIDALENLQDQVDRHLQNVSKPVITKITPEMQCREPYAYGFADPRGNLITGTTKHCDRKRGHAGDHAGDAQTGVRSNRA
jgi:hypothetical protein